LLDTGSQAARTSRAHRRCCTRPDFSCPRPRTLQTHAVESSPTPGVTATEVAALRERMNLSRAVWTATEIVLFVGTWAARKRESAKSRHSWTSQWVPRVKTSGPHEA
jgi:hypothetical protein